LVVQSPFAGLYWDAGRGGPGAGLTSRGSPRKPSEVEGKVGRIVAAGKSGEFEGCLRRHDGAFRWFLARFEPVRDDAGEIVRWYGTSTHIDALKQAKEKLREDQRALRRITGAIPQNIVILDPGGTPIYANRATLEHTGLTIADVVSSDFRARIFHPEDLERVCDQRQAAQAAAFRSSSGCGPEQRRAVSLAPHPLQALPRRGSFKSAAE
jgi:PAS domain-containing protein